MSDLPLTLLPLKPVENPTLYPLNSSSFAFFHSLLRSSWDARLSSRITDIQSFAHIKPFPTLRSGDLYKSSRKDLFNEIFFTVDILYIAEKVLKKISICTSIRRIILLFVFVQVYG